MSARRKVVRGGLFWATAPNFSQLQGEASDGVRRAFKILDQPQRTREEWMGPVGGYWETESQISPRKS